MQDCPMSDKPQHSVPLTDTKSTLHLIAVVEATHVMNMYVFMILVLVTNNNPGTRSGICQIRSETRSTGNQNG